MRKTIDLISEKFRRHGISNPSDDDVFQYMLSDEYINFISSTRAVPSESFGDIEKDLLRQVVLEGRIPSRQKDDEQMAEIKLVKAGVLVKIESYLEFSAPLIENIYIKKLYTERRPLHGSEDLDGFIVDCAQNFSKKALQLSFGRGKDDILYERQWQMEFYRVATSVLPERHGISADVGKIFDADGLIDFYINGQLQWGIELLRE